MFFVYRDNSISGNLFGTIRSLDTISSPISLNCTENADIIVHDESLHFTWSPFGCMGYTIINDTLSPLIENNWLLQRPNNNIFDWYFFGHGLNYKSALKDSSLLQGNIPLYYHVIHLVVCIVDGMIIVIGI